MSSKFFRSFSFLALVGLLALGCVSGCNFKTPWGGFEISSNEKNGNSDSKKETELARLRDELREQERLGNEALLRSIRVDGSDRETEEGFVGAHAARARQIKTDIEKLEEEESSSPAPVQNKATPDNTSGSSFHWKGWGDVKSPFWALVLLLSWLTAVFWLRDHNEAWGAATPFVVAFVGACIIALTPGAREYAGRFLIAGIMLTVATWCIYRVAAVGKLAIGAIALVLFYGLI